MIANEVSAAVNIGLALAAIAAMRAYWPRAPLHPGHGPGRTFYFAFLLLGVSVAMNAAAWGLWRIGTSGGFWWAEPMRTWFAWGDIFWKGTSAAGFLLLLRAKLDALDEDERPNWNMLTIAFHPNSDALFVRICGALQRRSFKKRG